MDTEPKEEKPLEQAASGPGKKSIDAKELHVRSLRITSLIVGLALIIGMSIIITNSKSLRTALKTQVDNGEETTLPTLEMSCPEPLVAGDTFTKTVNCPLDPLTATVAVNLIDSRPLDLYTVTLSNGAVYYDDLNNTAIGSIVFHENDNVDDFLRTLSNLPPFPNARIHFYDSCNVQCVCTTKTAEDGSTCEDDENAITKEKIQECTPAQYSFAGPKDDNLFAYSSIAISSSLVYVNLNNPAEFINVIQQKMSEARNSDNPNSGCAKATADFCGSESSLSMCQAGPENPDTIKATSKAKAKYICQTCNEPAASPVPTPVDAESTNTPNASPTPVITITCGPPGATLNEEEQANSNLICQGNNGGGSYCDTNGVCTTADGSPVPPPPGWLDNLNPSFGNPNPSP